MDNARQQIVDSINANSNILVTVSTDPSVDELAAALGLTILLNNLDKRATAVFSGAIPPAINFLEPDKTFEDTADSLRDFIIALDKEKADHLRYKVDGDVVKIFITPYRTTLSQNDLEFSQGDYNVELVIAIGVKDQDHLDKALAAHGKILHDASVVTITAGADTSKLGTIDWHDGAASSLSELMVSLVDGLKTDKPLFDQQIATALLTGIVSATDRFSNDRTSSRVMTMAAQLMAAGANQQLIAAKLEEAHDIAPGPVAAASEPKAEDIPEEKEEDQGTELSIDRSDRKPKEEEKDPVESPAPDAEAQLEQQLESIASPAATLEDIEKELKQAIDDKTTEPEASPLPPPSVPSDSAMPDFEAGDEPAPAPVAPEPPVPPVETEQVPTPTPTPDPVEQQPAAEIALPPLTDPVTPIINEHGTLSTEPPAQTQPINSIQGQPNEGEPTIDPFAVPPLTAPVVSAPVEQNAPIVASPVEPAPITGGTPEGAAVLGGMPPPIEPVQVPAPAPVTPQLPELPPLPPLPTDGSLPPLPPPPPLPDFGQPAATAMPSGPVSADQLGAIFGDASKEPVQPATPAPAPEPGQFRIPGQ